MTNIVVKCVAGSHLFGLNTSTSDKDYRGVYLPEPRDIVLGRIKTSISEKTNPGAAKNTSGDVDIELYSFCKFMRMLQEGQTVALELLFTPDDYIIEKSPLWDEIINMREQLIHKKVAAFIGYARTQANKYGIKGSRMGAIKKVLSILGPHLNTGKKLFHIWNDVLNMKKTIDFVNIIELPIGDVNNPLTCEHLEVCGKKFASHMRVGQAYVILEKIYANYGKRAKQAEDNEGIDWKAVSHALRVCSQGVELLSTGHITLPLPKDTREFIAKVKGGSLDFKSEVQPIVDEWINDLETAKNESMLPEELSRDLADGIIYDVYRGLLK